MTIKIVYKDGTDEEFIEGNLYNYNEDLDFIEIIKRSYDKDDDYDEDEDVELALIAKDVVKKLVVE